MTTVREINDPAELAALGQLWSELLARTPGASFFQSLEWLLVYWKHFGARKRLRVLVVYEDSRAVGILPLVLRPARRTEPLCVLTYPLDDWGHYYGPIGSVPALTLAAGLDHVRRTPRDWHFLELGWVDAMADGGRVKLALDNAGFPAVCEIQDITAMVSLGTYDSWDAYCAQRSGNWRNNLRRNEKKIATQGNVRYVRYRSTSAQSDPRWDLYDTCEVISRASWQHTAPRGTMLTKDANREFYRDCHGAAAEYGAVDMNILYIGEQPAAFSYCYHHCGHVTLVKTAFDPAVNSSGTGRVLQARQVADSLARGDLLYDLGSASMGWKQTWLTDLSPIRRYTHFPWRSPAAQVVRAKRALLAWWRKREAAAPDAPEFAAETV